MLTSEYDEPVVMYLRKSGKGEAVAGDIAPPAGVTIANPEQHIATLADDGELEIEFTVERGRGYVPAEMNSRTTMRSAVFRLIHLLPGTQGELQGRGHPCGTAHGLRQAHPGRGDQPRSLPA